MSGHPMVIRSLASGEAPLFDRVFNGGIMVLQSAVVTADTLINTGPCLYYGSSVHVATATAAITIENSLTAGGTVIDTLAASTGIGRYALGNGICIYCPIGLFINYAASATGSVSVWYWREI